MLLQNQAEIKCDLRWLSHFYSLFEVEAFLSRLVLGYCHQLAKAPVLLYQLYLRIAIEAELPISHIRAVHLLVSEMTPQ